ncbi:hypothetical protein ACLKA6_009775 [Drosophila palustris]
MRPVTISRGAISNFGTCELQFLTSRMNAQNYNEVLKTAFPHFQNVFHNLQWHFQHDNAPIHTARSVKSWIQDQKVDLLDWPPYSPDLNIIENVWGWLARKVYESGKQYSHNVSVCKSAHCRVCSKPHHTLLHKFVPESSALIAPLQHEQVPETDSSSQSPPASCNHMFGKKSEQVILATALVKVRGRSGGYHLARVLLDSGAQVNFVTEELANSLKLPKLREEIRVLGIGNLSSSSQHKVETSVASRDFYVADLLTGADSLEELDSMRRQLVEMLDSAGFTLPKWASNSTLRPLDSRNDAVALREHGDNKTLGLIWNPRADLFKYSLQEVEQNENPTKRPIVSFTARSSFLFVF